MRHHKNKYKEYCDYHNKLKIQVMHKLILYLIILKNYSK